MITLIGVGVRLLAMQVIQKRRERENRQINERLRTLIAAYKTLGGSFTGNLSVDPTHLRDLRRRDGQVAGDAAATDADHLAADSYARGRPHAERTRRMRDAVEAALSDIILLGTEQQVELAAHAASELTAGRPTPTAELVVSLRNFIRQVLDLEPIPLRLAIPSQGPTRMSIPRGKGESGAKDDSGRRGVGKGMGGGGSAGARMDGGFAGDDGTNDQRG